MDLNQIQYFIEICNSDSMAKAAERLHITQQGLSIAIRRLEAELNCDLFYRKSSGLVLTESGKVFKAEAEAIMKHVNRIYALHSTGPEGKTRINIAVTDSLIVRLPSQLQRLILNGTEEFETKLFESYSYACSNMVDNDEVSFAIVYGDYDTDLYDVITLDTIPQVFFVSKAHPLAQKDSIVLRDMDNVPIVVPDELSYPRKMLENLFEAEGIKLNVAYTCNRPRQTIQVVTNNPKIAGRVVLEELTDLDMEYVKVLKLTDHPFQLPVRLISKKSRRLTIQERLFKHMMIECY